MRAEKKNCLLFIWFVRNRKDFLSNVRAALECVVWYDVCTSFVRSTLCLCAWNVWTCGVCLWVQSVDTSIIMNAKLLVWIWIVSSSACCGIVFSSVWLVEYIRCGSCCNTRRFGSNCGLAERYTNERNGWRNLTRDDKRFSFLENNWENIGSIVKSLMDDPYLSIFSVDLTTRKLSKN